MEDDKIIIKLKKQPLESERKEIRQKRIKRLIITLVVILLMGVSFTGGYLISAITRSSLYKDDHSKFDKLLSFMSESWLYKSDYEDIEKELEDKAYIGMTTFDFDPYTSYMTKEESDAFNDSINQDFVGMGAQVYFADEEVVITKVYRNTPAENVGVLPGDRIIKVDDTVLDETNYKDVATFIKGERGTHVSVTVLRGEEEITFDIIRDQVNATVYGERYDDYLYIELNSFGDKTYDEFLSLLNDNSDLKKLIIDLRDNGGGYQTAVENILGIFIGPDEVYMLEEDCDGYSFEAKTSLLAKKQEFEKIIILTNSNTASASEVFTICLKESVDNVTVVGETTYGKGVVQVNMPIEGGSVLKYTAYKWLSPNGVWINGEGINPDVYVSTDTAISNIYVSFDENEEFGYDSVSPQTIYAAYILDYLGYDVDRFDGYFSTDFEKIIKQFQSDNGIDETGTLNYETYVKIYSSLIRVKYTDKSKDVQLNKAIELIGE